MQASADTVKNTVNGTGSLSSPLPVKMSLPGIVAKNDIIQNSLPSHCHVEAQTLPIAQGDAEHRVPSYGSMHPNATPTNSANPAGYEERLPMIRSS